MIEEFLNAISQGNLINGSLSTPFNKNAILRESIRPILIKGKQCYQITEHYKQKTVHKNISLEECVLFVQEKLKTTYQQGIFQTTSIHYHILVNKEKELKIIKKQLKTITPIQMQPHNRTKKHLLQEGVPVPFLIELGIMQQNGQVIAKKYDKFKQINRFVELVKEITPYLPKDQPIKIIDFGCGKASLTFALYHYLHVMEQREVVITGLDLKQEVIEYCQGLADRLGYTSLKFEVGDINHHETKDKVNLVISLHACNTATDAALEKAVLWNTDVILCVPCCQHELYNQVNNETLTPILRHGILKERFASLVTDAARAELLTILGYDVQVLEFIDLEHTPKNLMIKAIKQHSQIRETLSKARYKSFKENLQITPSLEKRFPLFF